MMMIANPVTMSEDTTPATTNSSISDAPTAMSSPSTPSTAPSNKGVAGRINYAQWDKVAKDLTREVDALDEEEAQAAKEALGLQGKYARSQAEADEKAKAKQVEKTKKALEKYQKRESQLMETLSGLLGPVPADGKMSSEAKSPDTQTVRITRDRLEAGKRVMTVCDTSGQSLKDTIVLTSDLSLLESQMSVNASAKSFSDDAENDAEAPKRPHCVYGVIKVFVSNVHNCTLRVKCKVISGCLEVHNCTNVRIVVEHDATVATIQADLSEDVAIEFDDAPSGKNNPGLGPKKRLHWGDDKDDRIFHAGVKNLQVKVVRDGYVESQIVSDYLSDGATAIGNATPEEFQFVTSVVNGKLVTEQIVRAGNTTGKNVRAMTHREVEEEKKKRDRAAELAVAMAEDMIKITDKDGNVLAKKTEPPVTAAAPNSESAEKDGIEEVYGGMSREEIQEIVNECEQNKVRGNEAFGAGEYGQAILLYSLALDKSDELPDADGRVPSSTSASSTHLFPRDVLYSNRSACFLKLGQHEKALEDAERALRCNPQNVKAGFRKGLSLHAMGRYREALPVLAEANKIEPKNKQILHALQFCEVRLQQEMRKLQES
jgi:tetratricopeptide (TPR) repeat protein